MSALVGKRVLVTRAREQAGSTADLLRARGAIPVVVPTIVIDPPTDPEPMRRAIADLGKYEWIVFTSANGVDRFCDAGAVLRSHTLAAIGPGTAKALET